MGAPEVPGGDYELAPQPLDDGRSRERTRLRDHPVAPPIVKSGKR